MDCMTVMPSGLSMLAKVVDVAGGEGSEGVEVSMQDFRLLLVAHCAYFHVNKDVNANNANEMQCCNALEASGWRWLLELVFCVKFKQ